MYQLFETKFWKKGPGIETKFYVFDHKIQLVQLSNHPNQGIKLEILSNQRDQKLFLKIEEWLHLYSLGKNPSFVLPLNLDQLPPFVQKVLTFMQLIAFGESCSYANLAVRSGSPRAARAVGSACRRNLFPLIVPCHRVVGSSKKLCGYSAGGLEMKKKLLDFENIIL